RPQATVVEDAPRPQAAVILPAPAPPQVEIIEPQVVESASPDPAIAEQVEIRPIEPVNVASAPLERATEQPLRERKTRSANWWIICLALAGALLSYILMIVSAFHHGATGWGIALILLAPLSNLAYALRHWREARVGFALGVVSTGICAAAYVPATDMIEVSDSYLTTRPNAEAGERRARVTFSSAETVHIKTVLDWDDWSVARPHLVTWIWYTGDAPANSFSTPVEFAKPPFPLVGDMPAAQLGSGKHSVEVYIDGELFDSRSFDIH
ncbi:MAG TPA: hypothetical protein VLI06_08175, partial [Solimonas sp.]|nr:hypothetical protein [Solimonas sp.]